MTDLPFKGGRGIKAPYKTTHIRVPEHIKSTLELIVETYKKCVGLGDSQAMIDYSVSLHEFARSYYFFAGALLSHRKFVRIDDYKILTDKIESATEEINRLKVQIELHEQARVQIAEFLEDACKLKANSGGAIKKEIRKVIDLLK